MRLQFPKKHWNQRHKIREVELRELERISSTIKFNQEKWDENKEKHWYYKNITIHGPLENNEWSHIFRTKAIYVWQYITSSIGTKDASVSIMKTCDIHCVSCMESNKKKYILMNFNDKYDRAEIICEDCHYKIFNNYNAYKKYDIKELNMLLRALNKKRKQHELTQ